MKILLAIAPFLFSALHASEIENASERIKKGLDGCVEKAQYTKEQIDCYSSYTDSLDAAMNDVYKKILLKLGPDQKKMVREAQRSWIQFRDKEDATSKAIYALIQGTIQHQYAASKTYALNEHRLQELEETLGILIHDIGK